MVQDLATQWIQAYLHKNKTSQETQRSLQKFLEPERKPKVTYTDNSLEFGKACEDLSWNHCTSTPHRSETNGIAEKSGAQSKGRHLCCIAAERERHTFTTPDGSGDSHIFCATFYTSRLRHPSQELPQGRDQRETQQGVVEKC